MADSGLNHVYARVLRNHPYGYALYEPQPSSVLQPGTCGYLTEKGTWTQLFDLSNDIEVKTRGFTPFSSISRAPPTGRLWGPKVSDSVIWEALKLKAGASVPVGIPTEIKVLMNFSSKKTSGAVLLTRGNVTCESVYYRKPYQEWCEKNSAGIVKLWPDVRDRGLWVVTETWHSAQVATNAWDDVEKSLTVGLDADLTPAGEIEAAADWHTAASDSGWIVHKMTNASDRHVVFFGGIFLHYSKVRQKLKKPAWRLPDGVRGKLHVPAPSHPEPASFPESESLSKTAYKFRSTGKAFQHEDPHDQGSELAVEVEEFGQEQTPTGG